MPTIWKYPLELTGKVQRIQMPEGAKILSVQDQRDSPAMWAEVDEYALRVTRYFRVYGTGHPITQGQYIGTAAGVQFVWHVYEQEWDGPPPTDTPPDTAPASTQ